MPPNERSHHNKSEFNFAFRAIASYIIWSNEGDLVFDPFAGSGTTLAVAKSLGRDFLGCEVNDEFADIADKRIKDTLGM